MSVNQNQPKTREQVKKARAEERRKQIQHEKRKKARRSPVGLRMLMLLAAVVVCVLAGMVVGYGVIGNGNVADALKESTWTHIHDLVVKKK